MIKSYVSPSKAGDFLRYQKISCNFQNGHKYSIYPSGLVGAPIWFVKGNPEFTIFDETIGQEVATFKD